MRNTEAYFCIKRYTCYIDLERTIKNYIVNLEKITDVQITRNLKRNFKEQDGSEYFFFWLKNSWLAGFRQK